eukprot:4490864-Amphidinium_carterae.1
MDDRLGPGFTLPLLTATASIHEQFPLSCPDMRGRMSIDPRRRFRPLYNTHKHMLFKTTVGTLRTQFLTAHSLALLQQDIHSGAVFMRHAKKAILNEHNYIGLFAHFCYAGSDVVKKWKAKLVGSPSAPQ